MLEYDSIEQSLGVVLARILLLEVVLYAVRQCSAIHVKSIGTYAVESIGKDGRVASNPKAHPIP